MLSDEKIILGPLMESDSATLFSWINDAELVRRSSSFRPVSFVNHNAWMDTVTKDPSRVFFSIRLVETEELIGVVQLFDIDSVHRSCELSIRIGDAHNRGKGLGAAAMVLTLDFAFLDLNLNRVQLIAFSDNAAAIATYKKVGFQVEGQMRCAFFIHGEWKDAYLMAALRNDRLLA